MTETLKAESQLLRGDLHAEIANGEASFSADSTQLLKFHGIYQQDDRDVRRERTRAGEQPSYSCMVRCSVPGGVLSAQQWLTIDAAASDIGDGSLRLTSRQGVQYHFVHKGELSDLIRRLADGFVSTYAACGDVVRNVMATTAPTVGVDLDRVQALAFAIDSHFVPQSTAYWELWIDGERAVSAGPAPAVADAEPIYGSTYLPRKFKIGIAWPGDSSVDVFSQDCGIVLVDRVDANGTTTKGAVVLAGGGLGRSHNKPETYPHLAQPLCWVPEDEVVEVVEAIVVAFRDHGDRENRKHARLKYLVAERGIGWLRNEVEQYLGRTLDDPVELPAWKRSRSELGWHRQPDGRWFLGVAVPAARLLDTESSAIRSAIRVCVEASGCEIRLTPHHDLLLCNIDGPDRASIDRILASHGVVPAEKLSLSVISSMACPALPTCGQALGEAERVLPQVSGALDRLLSERGLSDVAIETRMTGCPNGCSRPYVAELGIVGKTKRTYDLWLGGSPDGSRLAKETFTGIELDQLGAVLGPLLDRYQDDATGLSFGDWADAVGVDGLKDIALAVAAGERS